MMMDIRRGPIIPRARRSRVQEEGQDKSSSGWGLRDRVAIIRTLLTSLIFSSPPPILTRALARSEWGRPLGGASARRSATVRLFLATRWKDLEGWKVETLPRPSNGSRRKTFSSRTDSTGTRLARFGIPVEGGSVPLDFS